MNIVPPPFSASLARHGSVLHLHLTGELDLASVPELNAALPQPEPAETLLMDLRRLDFIDSSGIHVLMRLDVAARSEGWSLVLVRAPVLVQRVLDICHLGDRIRIVDSPAEISPSLA